MTQDIYEKLAKHYDTHPEGFPRTGSGIELKLLRKIFTEEEADIASQMKITPSSAVDIATRLGRDPQEMATKLREMETKGQISGFGPMENRIYYAHQFNFGVYQWQVEHLEKETVEIYQQWKKEAMNAELENMNPRVMRVLPVNVGIDAKEQVLPYNDVRELIKESKSLQHVDCMCRKEKRLLGKGCNHMKGGCLFFSSLEGFYDGFPHGEPITKEGALKILEEAEKEGLVHTTFNYANDVFNNICNCCSCCCLSMVNTEKVNTILARSDFYTQIDPEICDKCGECLDACPVKAIAKGEDAYSVNRERCVGCGICVGACPRNAVSMVPKPEDEKLPPPLTARDWMVERAKNRGISFDDIM